jgi:Restriction endonuclease
MARLEEETPFARTGEEVDEVTTRAPVEIHAIPFIPKERVAALPSLADHPIITAPLVTVYPIDLTQWEELASLLPPSLHFDKEGELLAADDLPAPFAWRQRRKGMSPLPGGYGEFTRALTRMLQWMSQAQPDEQGLESWLRHDFSMSASYARFTADFLARMSVIAVRGGRVGVTPEGRKWLSGANPGYLVALLHSRFQFVGEMLQLLTKPLSSEELLQLANQRYQMGWKTRTQVDRRRGWLQSTGAIESDSQRRLIITQFGREVLARLTLYSPSGEHTAPVETKSSEPAATSRPPGSLAGSTRAAELAARLRQTAIESGNPTAFEDAVAEAFGFLGFESTRLGGSGKTDVLIMADLGPTNRYRAIIDCKSTGREAVKDPQIDWMTLAEHKKLHEADYVAMVASAYAGQRLSSRAKATQVTLIDVETLAGMCVQHEKLPMGLEVYRGLFTASDAEAGAAAAADAAEESGRFVMLSAAVLGQIRRLERTESALSARDLYWNLRSSGEQFATVTDKEIQLVLEALASPALAVVREVEPGKFQTLGSLDTAVRRVKLLAGLIEEQITDRPVSE